MVPCGELTVLNNRKRRDMSGLGCFSVAVLKHKTNWRRKGIDRLTGSPLREAKAGAEGETAEES